MPYAEGRLRAVFLDRDGVLTRSHIRDGRPYAPTAMEDFEIVPGAIEATQALRQAGFRLVVVTNQPDVGAGKVEREVVERMHIELRRRLPLDGIKVCYHLDAHACACRKPKPGMILEAAGELGIDLSRSFMVGDRWRDIGAGQAAGCKTVFLDSGYDEPRPSGPDVVVTSVTAAARAIIEELV
jgi:D-glycero-D-manno-heptose 1,7-bisphosphate phosphatase